MTEKKIDSIGAFLDETCRARENWRLADKKELWFRGESRDHQRLDFPHITRRVAAQRSRFVVFGTDLEFLAEEYKRESCIKRLCIDGKCRRSLRRELRDSGVTDSVILNP